MENEEFLNIKISYKHLDKFYIRKKIFDALQAVLPLFKGNLLDVGCGKMPYKNHIIRNSKITNYTGLDIETAIQYDKKIKPDYTWDGNVMPFDNFSFETVFATEVLEHCPEPQKTLDEIFRVLKHEGVFFFTVPFIWNLHEVPHDEFRYTPYSLTRLLKNSGFDFVEISPTGGWHASFAQMLGLWVRRAPMNRIVRRGLTHLLIPIFKLLLFLDSKNSVKIQEGIMIPGLSGIAIKK
jgi:SAM-dependent methyltransferase